MPVSDYLCEKAADPVDVAQIAKYLHLTDPYIYPKLCIDPEDPDWQAFIGGCVKMPGNIYHRHNLSVVRYHGQIVGVACVIPCGQSLTITEGIPIPASLKKNMPAVVTGYFDLLIQESAAFDGHNVVNICIDHRHQGRGVGKLLLNHCISVYGAGPIHLDVIAANTAAVRLYKSCGFLVDHEYFGFSGDDSKLPCYHMIRPADPASVP